MVGEWHYCYFIRALFMYYPSEAAAPHNIKFWRRSAIMGDFRLSEAPLPMSSPRHHSNLQGFASYLPVRWLSSLSQILAPIGAAVQP